MAEDEAVALPKDDATPGGEPTEQTQEPVVVDATADTTPPAEAPDTVDQEVDVVRRGADGSQPSEQDISAIVQKRIKRLNRKNSETTSALGDTKEALAQAKQIIEIQNLALQQQREPKPEAAKPPDPSDEKYDEGVYDPKFVTDYHQYQANIVQAEVKKQAAAYAPRQPEVSPELIERQKRHIKRADDLGAKDYDAIEEKAIEVLGSEFVNNIILNEDKSTEVIYYLGKNPGEAAAIAELVKSNPVKGVLRIGALAADLQVKKPQVKQNQAPDPDEELEGKSTAQPVSSYQKNYDKLVDAIGNGTKTMHDLANFRRENPT